MDYYGIGGIFNDSCKSYLSTSNQFVFINGYDSAIAPIDCAVSQVSIIGPLLFLLCINDLNQRIVFCKVPHFADGINLLCLRNSINKIDLKHLVNWLNKNKISLNIKNAEMVIFKSKQKKLEGNLKMRLCGNSLHPTESVKYLDVKIDANLSWQCQVNDISIKLNRVNARLFKMRKYVSPKILRSICFVIFESHLSYCSPLWAQNFRTI